MTDATQTQALMTGAGAQAPSTLASAHPVVQDVVQSVYSDPNVPTENAAYVAASILNGVAQYAPAVLQVTRASPVSSMWAGIGIGMMSSIIQAFFPHPRAQ